MVYLGPVELRYLPVKNPGSRLSAPTAISALKITRAYGEDYDEAAIDEVLIEQAPYGQDRRKHDRRSKTDHPLLETRSRRDRRKSTVSINITI